ncbi:MAG: single-stranded DNA-binding protein [Oscillospiraceae bacterium]|nr:single-stranded DNA-binding protein [Oscillospiraceae bacterium]
MLNRVILMGRITAAPELKTTSSGVSVTSFSLAVDRNYVKQGEQRQTDFINVVCWRQQAEFVCRYFGKGSMIAIEGQLQTRTYQAKDGTNRYVTEVVADNISFTGERRDQTNRGDYGNSYNNGYQPQQMDYEPQQPVQPSYSNGSASDFEEMPLDDDLPF